MSDDQTLDNPFDSSTDNESPETKPLEHVIDLALLKTLLELHTWAPASVQTLNQDGTVEIQPLLKGRYLTASIDSQEGGAKTLTPPTIDNVPVWQLRGANWGSVPPLATGDTGIALFCERSLDAWLAGDGSATDPADSRHHDYNDPIFIPGCYPTQSATKGNGQDWTFTNGNGSQSVVFTLYQDGHVGFKVGSAELTFTIASDHVDIGFGGGTAKLTLKSSGEIDIGAVPTGFVAMATLVASELNKIVTTLASGSNSGGPVVFSVPYVPGSVAATQTKAQ